MFFDVHSSQALITAIHPPPPPFPTAVTALIVANKIPAPPHLPKPPDPSQTLLGGRSLDFMLLVWIRGLRVPALHEGTDAGFPQRTNPSCCATSSAKINAPPLSCGVSTGSNVAETPSDVPLGMHCVL